MYYSTKIFASAGAGNNAAFTSSVWIGLINLAFTFVAIAFVDKAGRRPLLLVGTLLQTVALGLVGWMFHQGQSGTALLLCIILFIAAFSMAIGPIAWLFCSEIFPNKIRGRALAVASFCLWIANFLVSQTFPMIDENPWLKAKFNHGFPFYLYAAFCVVLVWIVVKFVPETKGRTLEEIEQHWRL